MTGQNANLDEHLLELARNTQTRYRSPEQIRAIPNDQWERWLENETLPFASFSSERTCQKTLRTILAATRRRMDAQR